MQMVNFISNNFVLRQNSSTSGNSVYYSKDFVNPRLNIKTVLY